MSSSEQVRASHILIKHEGSRRKSSWRDPEGSRISATKRDSAVAQLKTIRDDIIAGKTRFDDVASRLSDCSSAKRGGDLGSPFSIISVAAFQSLEMVFLLTAKASAASHTAPFRRTPPWLFFSRCCTMLFFMLVVKY